MRGLPFRIRPTTYGYRASSHRSRRDRRRSPSHLNPLNWTRLWKAYWNARRLGYDFFTAWRAAKKSI